MSGCVDLSSFVGREVSFPETEKKVGGAGGDCSSTVCARCAHLLLRPLDL